MAETVILCPNCGRECEPVDESESSVEWIAVFECECGYGWEISKSKGAF